jgi:hypothetical protein
MVVVVVCLRSILASPLGCVLAVQLYGVSISRIAAAACVRCVAASAVAFRHASCTSKYRNGTLDTTTAAPATLEDTVYERFGSKREAA